MVIVDLPHRPIAAKIKWTLRQPTQVNRGEFGGGRRTTILAQAARWSAEVEYPVILGEKAVRPWRAALAMLQGQANAFRLIACENPQRLVIGRAGGPFIDGANQTGSAINTRGWWNCSAVLTGYFVTIADRLHQVVAQTLVDANGKGVIHIMPPIAGGVPDGAAIVAGQPYGVMALTSDSAGWTVSPGQQYTIGFSCEEAF